MSKRGQTTLFIILGIIIIIIVGLVIYLTQSDFSLSSEELNLPTEVQDLKQKIDSCSYDIAEGSLAFVGLHGGYPEVTIASYEYDSDLGLIDVPYLYNEGNDNTLSDDTIVNLMEQSIVEDLDDCISFENYDFEITKDVNVEVSLEDGVDITIDYPMTLVFEENSYDLENVLEYHEDVRLSYMNEVARGIVQENVNDPGYIPTTYIVESGLDVTYWPVEDTVGIYIIEDENSLINDEPFLFMFAMNYEVEA